MQRMRRTRQRHNPLPNEPEANIQLAAKHAMFELIDKDNLQMTCKKCGRTAELTLPPIIQKPEQLANIPERQNPKLN